MSKWKKRLMHIGIYILLGLIAVAYAFFRGKRVGVGHGGSVPRDSDGVGGNAGDPVGTGVIEGGLREARESTAEAGRGLDDSREGLGEAREGAGEIESGHNDYRDGIEHIESGTGKIEGGIALLESANQRLRKILADMEDN